MKEVGMKYSNPLRYTYGFILGFLFKFVLDIIFSLTYASYNLFQPLKYYLVSIVLTFLIFELLFQINKFIDKKYHWDERPIERFVYQLLINSLIAISVNIVFRLGIRWSTGQTSFVSLQDEAIIILFVFIIILGFVIMQMSVFLLNKWRFSLGELERFKKENAEYRFELLQSQLNPHFLFNSLNTLSSLVYENQENASLFIRKLSDVYRYILDNRDKDVVSLETELAFVESYILLMKLRFDDHLDVKLELEGDIQKYRLAPLTLQLLMENAIKHNIVSKKKPLSIEIILDKDFIQVKNNLQPKINKESSHQLGLKNINSRYQFLTDRKVEIEQTETDFTVKIPLLINEK